LLTKEYEFIVQRLNSKSWTELTREFNKEFGMSLTPNALQKRYDREIAKLEALGDDSVEKAVQIIRSNPIKPTDLARRFNLDLDGLEDLLDDLINSRAAIQIKAGYLVFDRGAPTPDNLTYQMDLLRQDDWVKYGVISDLHICSVHERLDLLHNFYKICEEEKVQAIFCAGDLSAGNGTVYKGQMADLKIYGEDKQINYICSVYPETGIKTYTISGNHDLDLYKQCGSDLLQKVAEKRQDIVYLGKISGTIEDNGFRIMLKHGDGGLGAFKSYKPQKLVDALKPEDVCDITVIGHYHINLYIPKHRGSTVILPGCFEAQSDYLLKKSLEPEIGGCIIQVKAVDTKDGKKIYRHRPDFLDMGQLGEK
jgi:predicted phosphodiesterase